MDRILAIPYQATIELQKKDLKLSDVFGIWLKTKLGLRKLTAEKKDSQTNLAKYLLTCIDKRNDTIFSNPFMSSAIFLDPRFRGQISRDENKMEQAKTTLKNVWRRLIVIENLSSPGTQINASNTSNNSDPSFEFDADDELDKFLSGNVQNQSNQPNQQIREEDDIEFLLDNFNPPSISSKTDVLEYWENEKHNNAVLYRLAAVIYSIPPTEVQIERDFSELNFVFSSRRCSLTKEHLEDIMIIHLNKDLFYVVNNEQLEKFKNRPE